MTNENNEMTSPRKSDKTKLQWIDKGQVHYKAKQYEEALHAFEQALQLDPKFALAFHLKALVLFGLNRIIEGRNLIEQASKIRAEELQTASGWEPIDIPGGFFERLSGFSLPVDYQVVLISSEGLHTLDLSHSEDVHSDNEYPEGGDLYDWEHHVLHYNGRQFQILRVHGGHPVLKSEYGEQLLFDFQSKVLIIEDRDRNVQLKYQFEDLSWQWGYASFSNDSNFVLLGLPYFIAIFRRTL